MKPTLATPRSAPVVDAVKRHGQNWEAIAFELDSDPATCQAAYEEAVRSTPASDEVRLEALAAEIREQAAHIEHVAEVLVVHAVRIGEALLAAQELVPSGDWTRWVRANTPFARSKSSCRNYMRLAALKEHVDPQLTIAANLKMVAGLQRASAKVERRPEAMKAEARRLWATGQFSYGEIARALGTTAKSVHAWVDPDYAEHVRELTRQTESGRRARQVPDKTLPRSHRYGEPGRAALNAAVRRLAKTTESAYVVDALLDVEAIASAWRERLEQPGSGVTDAA